MIAFLSTAVKLEGSDIATLCNELTGISDWCTLGLNLGVPYHLLEEVRRNYSVEGLSACRRETLVLWLQRVPSASWRDVVAALRQMGENIEAKTIEQKYIVGPMSASKLQCCMQSLCTNLCIPMCCAYLHVTSSTFYVITAKMIEDARDATTTGSVGLISTGPLIPSLMAWPGIAN